MTPTTTQPTILLVSLVHNRKHLLHHAVQSVLKQTLSTKHFQYLLFDNASTDGASKVAKTFAQNHKHIHYEHCNTNLGQQKAYNYILEKWIPKHLPDTKIMAVLDSDDMLINIALEEVYKTYEQYPNIGGTYSGFNIIDRKNRVIHKNHAKARYIPNQDTEEGQKRLRKFFLANNPCGHMRSYSIDKLRKIGGFHTGYQFSTDYNIFGRLFAENYMVLKINKVLYNFRQHGDQIQSKSSPQQTKDWRDMQAEFRKVFAERGLV